MTKQNKTIRDVELYELHEDGIHNAFEDIIACAESDGIKEDKIRQVVITRNANNTFYCVVSKEIIYVKLV